MFSWCHVQRQKQRSKDLAEPHERPMVRSEGTRATGLGRLGKLRVPVEPPSQQHSPGNRTYSHFTGLRGRVASGVPDHTCRVLCGADDSAFDRGRVHLKRDQVLPSGPSLFSISSPSHPDDNTSEHSPYLNALHAPLPSLQTRRCLERAQGASGSRGSASPSGISHGPAFFWQRSGRLRIGLHCGVTARRASK